MLAAGVLPFLICRPGRLLRRHVKYGAGTYKIVGYGLSAILVRAGILDDRDGAYPFALFALLTWAAADASGCCWCSAAPRELWVGAAGFAISILWLLFIGRTFNNYYLVWPLTGGALSRALLAALASQRVQVATRPVR